MKKKTGFFLKGPSYASILFDVIKSSQSILFHTLIAHTLFSKFKFCFFLRRYLFETFISLQLFFVFFSQRTTVQEIYQAKASRYFCKLGTKANLFFETHPWIGLGRPPPQWNQITERFFPDFPHFKVEKLKHKKFYFLSYGNFFCYPICNWFDAKALVLHFICLKLIPPNRAMKNFVKWKKWKKFWPALVM